jgi:acetyltransferase-like isoleucine patch superfamily enzyme
MPAISLPWTGKLWRLRFFLKRKLYSCCSMLLVDNTVSMRIRAELLRFLGAGVGRKVTIRGGLVVFEGFDFTLGNGVFIGDHCIFDCSAPICIGDNVFIAYGVTLVTGTHAIGPRECRAGNYAPRGVTIGDGCWIGARSVILPGIHIGRGVVVGAGSVVTRDVPPDTVVAGNPARPLRSLGPLGKEAEYAART